MSTTARVHYWSVVNDDSMDSLMVRELIEMLEEYVAELEEEET